MKTVNSSVWISYWKQRTKIEDTEQRRSEYSLFNKTTVYASPETITITYYGSSPSTVRYRHLFMKFVVRQCQEFRFYQFISPRTPHLVLRFIQAMNRIVLPTLWILIFRIERKCCVATFYTKKPLFIPDYLQMMCKFAMVHLVDLQNAFIFTARKWSLGQGNVFTSVCTSVHEGGDLHQRGRSASRAGGVCIGGGLGRPSPDTTGYGQQTGGTHPTGMHSCSCNAKIYPWLVHSFLSGNFRFLILYDHSCKPMWQSLVFAECRFRPRFIPSFVYLWNAVFAFEFEPFYGADSPTGTISTVHVGLSAP